LLQRERTARSAPTPEPIVRVSRQQRRALERQARRG
jgi:hypothetical protein